MNNPGGKPEERPRPDPPEAVPAASPVSAPPDVAPTRLSNLILAICAGITILLGLCVVIVVCVLSPISGHPIVEAMILAAIVLWLSIPLATADRDLLVKAGFFAGMLFAILYFIAYQTIVAFWVILIVLVLLVLMENTRRQDDQPTYTTIAQIIALTSLIAFCLRKFTEFFLPSLQTALTEQFAFLFQMLKLREAVAVTLGLIILYATGLNTFQKMRQYQWSDYGRPPTPDSILATLIHDVVYYARNFFRIIRLAFVTVLREFIDYIVTTFFGRILWRRILNILLTAGLSALLVAQLMAAKPTLVEVLRNSEPFFTPTLSLLLAYAALLAVYVLTIVEITALTAIWLPRGAGHAAQHPAFQNLTLASAGSVICMWVAAFTAWLINYVFHFDDKQFVTPGYFTSLAAIYFVWALLTYAREPAPPASPDDIARNRST